MMEDMQGAAEKTVTRLRDAQAALAAHKKENVELDLDNANLRVVNSVQDNQPPPHPNSAPYCKAKKHAFERGFGKHPRASPRCRFAPCS